ncbi:hypothetical protein [Streptomyces griseorubiginosus]|uniref:hypothetical protein n=1 Tax=Streptomyces griseorubiginosus TaxID=67304 RepID=UPI001AD740FF|nr:hypothetical protein [Streptomyces griseorubiginosus]MBO4259505.1 hypothetical protein [Streptomyces griseorubiginosus]
MIQQHRTPSLTAVRNRDRRTAISALLALATITLTAGCSSGGGDNAETSPTPSSATPTKTMSADEAQARKDVIAAYQGMNDEEVKAYAKSSLAGSDITKYATGDALRDAKDTVFVNMRNGIVVKGEPKVTTSEDDVTFDASGARAALSVCFDLNTWESVDKKTGKSLVPPNQVKRYTITAHLQKQSSRWLVTDEKAHKDKPC